MTKTYSGCVPDLYAGGVAINTRFVSAGYADTPRKGQWYLSGAVPCAYLAPNDLSTTFTIAYPIRNYKEQP